MVIFIAVLGSQGTINWDYSMSKDSSPCCYLLADLLL